jgi:hypothetical protein
LSDKFPIQNGLKQGDTLLTLLLDFALEYATRRGQENQKGNGTHQLLVYAEDINTVGGNTDTIQKNIEAPLDDSKEVGLEVKPRKIQSMC